MNLGLPSNIPFWNVCYCQVHFLGEDKGVASFCIQSHEGYQLVFWLWRCRNLLIFGEAQRHASPGNFIFCSFEALLIRYIKIIHSNLNSTCKTAELYPYEVLIHDQNLVHSVPLAIFRPNNYKYSLHSRDCLVQRDQIHYKK